MSIETENYIEAQYHEIFSGRNSVRPLKTKTHNAFYLESDIFHYSNKSLERLLLCNIKKKSVVIE